MQALFVFLLLATTAIAAINEVDGSTSTQTPKEIMGLSAPGATEAPVEEEKRRFTTTGDVELVRNRHAVCHEPDIMMFWFIFLITSFIMLTFILVKLVMFFQEYLEIRQRQDNLRDKIVPVLVVQYNKHRGGTSCGVPF